MPGQVFVPAELVECARSDDPAGQAKAFEQDLALPRGIPH